MIAPCDVWQRQDSDGGDGRHCSSRRQNRTLAGTVRVLRMEVPLARLAS